jgi:hypothetical protein
MIGTRQEASDYLDKVKHIRASGNGLLPTIAKRPVRTFAEEPAAAESFLFEDLCAGLLAHIKANPYEYKDQKNPPQRIGLIKRSFGHRHAASIKPSEIKDWLDSLENELGTRHEESLQGNVLCHLHVWQRTRQDPRQSSKRRETEKGKQWCPPVSDTGARESTLMML